jgi:hypothetical protein
VYELYSIVLLTSNEEFSRQTFNAGLREEESAKLEELVDSNAGNCLLASQGCCHDKNTAAVETLPGICNNSVDFSDPN